MRLATDLHGVLVIDKPPGLTSAAVVARVKHVLRAARVGHTGTLDPMATGVLPVVVGEGTKLAAFLLADDKEYEGELELGVVTDTLDAQGKVLRRADAGGVDEGALRAAMAAWVGARRQLPPMYSALKQDGARLYELARAGVEVEREPRDVTIDRFELARFFPPRAGFTVACSKGTYVRALVRDVGEALGCGATLTALRRTRAGIFTLDQAIPLDQVAGGAAAAGRLVAPHDALPHLPALVLEPDAITAIKQGKLLPAPEGLAAGARLRLVSASGGLVAIGEVRDGRIASLRGFNDALAADL